jgi:PKD repeat protein
MKKPLVLALLLMIILSQAGHIQSNETEDLDNKYIELSNLISTHIKSNYTKIESNLLRLIDDDTIIANRNTLNINEYEIIDDKIRVEVSLKDEQSLSYLNDFDEHIILENHYKSLAQILIPQDLLIDLSKEEYVQFIRNPIRPILTTTSEGVAVIGADFVQAAGYNGSGIKVAVIDLGFDGYSTNPDLPSSRIKEVMSFRADHDIECDEVHGSACAEIVLDIAPQADLYLYNFDTISELNDAVNRAISVGIDIITFSIAYVGINDYNGIGYSTIGDVCGIVNNARSHGILFVVSAGNYAQSHYCGNYIDVNSNDFHDFDTESDRLSLGYIPAGYPIDLELSWNDWPGSDQDYDLWLVDKDVEYYAVSDNYQTGSEPPTEEIFVYAPESDDYYVLIDGTYATSPVRFQLFSYYCTFDDNNHPETSISCPADATGAMAVGATLWSNDNLEDYSSRGPTTDGRTKPDLTAPDGISTYAYEPNEFYGTSASAPHTAGAAALLLSIAPNLTVDELQSKLETTALDLGNVGKDNMFGSGRIDVWNAHNYIVPTADFSFAPSNPNTSTSLQFTDESSDTDGSITSWLWDFGEGNTSILQNPIHQYNNNGTYTVTLHIADDDGATNETTSEITITNVAPTANYTYNPENPTDIQTIIFTDTSTDPDGTITSWSWDFGDGNTSTQQNPSHQYDDNGTYDVTLNVTDDDGATNETTQMITILNVRPVMNFTYDPSNPTDLQIITFTDNCVDIDGSIVTWSWDFDDGNTSTDQHPTHQFDDNKSYTVTLNVTDNDGATNETTRTISVSNVPPTVEFSYTPLKPNVDQTITFTDSSNDPDGSITSWSWDFDDGNTSTDQHPTHSYSDNGTYQVTLNITDNDGDTNQSSTQLSVYWGPNANFTWEPQYPEFDQIVYFNDKSVDYDGSITTWSWDLGDGNTSSDQNTTHIYLNPGSYIVSLNVTDNTSLYGVISKTIIINVAPQANFTFQPSSPYTEDTIQFNDTTVDTYGELINWSWDFGDGTSSHLRNATHRYTDNGTYTVTLNVIDNCTAMDTKQKVITVLNTRPYVNFTYFPSNPTDLQTILFNDTTMDCDGIIMNWTWDLGDGTVLYDQNISHQYSDNGTYQVILNVTDDDGDQNQTAQNIVVLNVAPSADFTYSPDTPACNETVLFNSSATDEDGSISNYTWTIDGVDLYYTQNISYAFTIFDSHTVNLTVRDDDNSETKISKIVVMRNTSMNTTFNDTMTTIDLIDDLDITVMINTTEHTQVNISRYSDNPTDDSTLFFASLGKYYEITVSNESCIIWPINITVFYTSGDLVNASINESQLLGLYYWNDTLLEWRSYEETGVNITDQSEYAGFIWANAYHLTNITPGGDTQAPGNVSGLDVTDAKNGKLNINWDETTDNTNIAYYRIYCDKKDTINTSDNSTSYQYTGLTNGVTYTFNVSAVDIVGNEGNRSTSASGTPTAQTSSSPPSGGGGGGALPGPTNIPPSSQPGGPYQGYAQVNLEFDGSKSTDPDGNITEYQWDLGDGTIKTGNLISHAYEIIGNYTVTLTVTDDLSAVASNTTYAVIHNLAPQQPDIIGPTAGTIDDLLVYTLQDNDENNDPIRFIIDWGDTCSTETNFSTEYTVTNISHRWDAPGIYQVKAIAMDIHNDTSDPQSITVLINTIYCEETGYIMDLDNDGIYDTFTSNSTGISSNVVYKDNIYQLDIDKDGTVDYTFDEIKGLQAYAEPDTENQSPGFEFYIFIMMLLMMVIISRKKR